MSVLISQKNLHDWHRVDIIAALHKQGWSIRQLAFQHGISPSTIKGALEASIP